MFTIGPLFWERPLATRSQDQPGSSTAEVSCRKLRGLRQRNLWDAGDSLMMMNNGTEPTAPEIKEELDRILTSKVFSAAQRSQAFLRYVVERFLMDAPPPLKEFSIAMDVFARGDDYDPSIDATVRVEAGRLRSRLREYYDTEGRGDPISIDV